MTICLSSSQEAGSDCSVSCGLIDLKKEDLDLGQLFN